MKDLFTIESISVLADAGKEYSASPKLIAGAQSFVTGYSERKLTAQRIADELESEISALTLGWHRVVELRTQLQTSLEKDTRASYQRTVLECVTEGKAIELARECSDKASAIAHLSSSLDCHRQTLLPEVSVRAMVARATMLREEANEAMAQALFLAIARHQAAEKLMAVDGIAVFSADGAANLRWREALEMHRKAAEAAAAADREASRQRRLNRLLKNPRRE